jgi:phosphoribosylformimino-5-aminoimidazole carboxamide ribonucleotide (ProFAR) isomerase
VLASAVPYLPAPAVHLALVDPFRAAPVRGIAVRTADGSTFVAPDNGLTSQAWEVAGGAVAAHVLDNTELWNPAPARTFRGRLVGGIDARDGLVAVRGWLDTTQVRAIDLAKELVSLGIEWIVYTDIASDGMLKGANVAAMREMVEAVPQAKVIASGGVSSVEDVQRLKEIGAAGAIIGMALYTGTLKLEDALEAAC